MLLTVNSENAHKVCVKYAKKVIFILGFGK